MSRLALLPESSRANWIHSVEQLHQADAKGKELAKAVLPAGNEEEEVNDAKEDSPESHATTGREASSEDTDDDDVPPVRRQLRGGVNRATDRKRKREEAEAARKEKKAKASAPKLTKEEQELKKTIAAVEALKDKIRACEDQMDLINKDLQETECQRTKCLGRDRFCNRYYWFERNGMAYEGEEGSSTQHYGYANGRIWVQGPDAMEREGFIDLPDKEQQQYKGVHGMTVTERKEEEEGPTPLHNAKEWAYLGEPDSVDQLIAWLDERGNREKGLRKELQTYRDDIVACMRKMRAHLDEVEAKEGRRRRAGDGDAHQHPHQDLRRGQCQQVAVPGLDQQHGNRQAQATPQRRQRQEGPEKGRRREEGKGRGG